MGWITKTTNWSIASPFLAHAEFSKQTLFLRSRYQIVPISTKHGDFFSYIFHRQSWNWSEHHHGIRWIHMEHSYSLGSFSPTPTWKMMEWVRQLGWFSIPNWMESHKIPWFQTTNQLSIWWFFFHVFSMGEKLSSTHPRRSFNSLGSSDWSGSLRESLATLPGLVFPMENPVENPLENQHHCKCSQYPLVN